MAIKIDDKIGTNKSMLNIFNLEKAKALSNDLYIFKIRPNGK